MRLDPSRGRTAQALLSTLNEAGLARLLAENSDEPHALELAGAILRAHAREPISSTRSLAALVRETVGGRCRSSNGSADAAVRRVFQAVRIAVNDELGSLSALVRSLPSCLKPGGRVAILSFHSGEDRLVKAAFKAGLQDGTYASITTEVIRAGADEGARIHVQVRPSYASLSVALNSAIPNENPFRRSWRLPTPNVSPDQRTRRWLGQGERYYLLIFATFIRPF